MGRRGGQNVVFGGSQGFCWNELWPRSLPSVSLVGLMFLHWADGGFHQIQIHSRSSKAEHANLAGWPNVPSVCAFPFLFQLCKGAVFQYLLMPEPKGFIYFGRSLLPKVCYTEQRVLHLRVSCCQAEASLTRGVGAECFGCRSVRAR